MTAIGQSEGLALNLTVGSGPHRTRIAVQVTDEQADMICDWSDSEARLYLGEAGVMLQKSIRLLNASEGHASEELKTSG